MKHDTIDDVKWKIGTYKYAYPKELNQKSTLLFSKVLATSYGGGSC